MSAPVKIRPGTPDDAALILHLITQLAIYEREPDAVEATEDSIRDQMMATPSPFEVLIAELDGEPAGFALFFMNYSTWKGRPGIYLEDLFVPEEQRGHGIGTALMRRLAQIALDRGAARMDWQVLDWNEPSIRYYESIGADINRDWFPCRLSGDALRAMAEQA